MICDKHCPLLNLDTGDCKGDEDYCPLNRDRSSICGDCIHDKVCGEEGHLDPAMTFCADKVSKDVVGMIGRVHGLRLSDLIPYLVDTPWFTVIRKSGETCNQITYTYPERFKVLRISFDHLEQKIVIILDEEET